MGIQIMEDMPLYGTRGGTEELEMGKQIMEDMSLYGTRGGTEDLD